MGISSVAYATELCELGCRCKLRQQRHVASATNQTIPSTLALTLTSDMIGWAAKC